MKSANDISNPRVAFGTLMNMRADYVRLYEYKRQHYMRLPAEVPLEWRLQWNKLAYVAARAFVVPFFKTEE